MSRIIHLFFFTQDCMQAMPHPTPDARRSTPHHDANMLRRRHCLLTIPSTQSTHNGNSGFSSIIPPIFFFIQFSLPTNITHTTTSTRSNTGSIVLIRSYFFPFLLYYTRHFVATTTTVTIAISHAPSTSFH